MSDSDSLNLGAPACFVFYIEVDHLDGLKLCRAAEMISGKGTIIGAQKMGKRFRLYPSTPQARETLITQGITYENLHISILTNNPFIDTGKKSESVKVIIGNIPLSVSSTEIMDSLIGIEGVNVRSRLFFEGYRDVDKTLTSFKTGRRFIHIDKPASPLPKFFHVGQWRASLNHFGQNAKQNTTHQPVDNAIVPTALHTVGGEIDHDNINKVTPSSPSVFTNSLHSDNAELNDVNRCEIEENNEKGKPLNKQTKSDITNFLSRGRPEYRRSRSSGFTNRVRQISPPHAKCG